MSLDYERRIFTNIRYALGFIDEPVPRETVLRILDTARWAPSIGFIQPWEIIVIDDKFMIKKIAGVLPIGRRIHNAPVYVVIVTDPRIAPNTHLVDGGSLATYIMVQASLHGLAVYPVYLNNDPIVRSILGIPAHLYLHTLIAIGKPASRVPIRQPKTLNTILYHNRYGIRFF